MGAAVNPLSAVSHPRSAARRARSGAGGWYRVGEGGRRPAFGGRVAPRVDRGGECRAGGCGTGGSGPGRAATVRIGCAWEGHVLPGRAAVARQARAREATPSSAALRLGARPTVPLPSLASSRAPGRPHSRPRRRQDRPSWAPLIGVRFLVTRIAGAGRPTPASTAASPRRAPQRLPRGAAPRAASLGRRVELTLRGPSAPGFACGSRRSGAAAVPTQRARCRAARRAMPAPAPRALRSRSGPRGECGWHHRPGRSGERPGVWRALWPTPPPCSRRRP